MAPRFGDRSGRRSATRPHWTYLPRRPHPRARTAPPAAGHARWHHQPRRPRPCLRAAPPAAQPARRRVPSRRHPHARTVRVAALGHARRHVPLRRRPGARLALPVATRARYLLFSQRLLAERHARPIVCPARRRRARQPHPGERNGLPAAKRVRRRPAPTVSRGGEHPFRRGPWAAARAGRARRRHRGASVSSRCRNALAASPERGGGVDLIPVVACNAP